jgi:signal transduction histidine kinase/CheY-like chemotaxis protein
MVPAMEKAPPERAIIVPPFDARPGSFSAVAVRDLPFVEPRGGPDPATPLVASRQLQPPPCDLDFHARTEKSTSGSRDMAERLSNPPRATSEELLARLRTAEAPLAELVAELVATDRMASLGTLAGGVAHEINNPLAAVIANIELALDDIKRLQIPNDKQELLEELEDAREAAHRVRQIVRDLRLFSRAEDDRKDLVDVREVLESTLRMAWNEIRHRAKLVKAFDEVPLVDANDARLGQVFLNLVLNAVHAIAAGRAETNEIRVSTMLEGNEVVVEVKDSGEGMTEAVRARIFEPFFSARPAGGGRGLGLPISQRIVEELGGRIEVRTRPGAGSAFTVRLPAADEPGVKPPTVRPPPVPRDRRGRVLVVDDERIVATAVARTLSPDHDVEMEDESARALERIHGGERFDVILCDVMMPNLSGVDFYLELERIAPEELDKIVFLTGGAFVPQAREFLDNVPNLRLEKPFTPEELRDVVSRLLSPG